MNQQPTPSKLTPLGRLISILLVAGLITAGVWLLKKGGGGSSPTSSAPGQSGGDSGTPEVAEFLASQGIQATSSTEGQSPASVKEIGPQQ